MGLRWLLLLLKIKKLGFSRIFLESGIKLTYNFLSEKLIDDFKLFISDRKIGSNGRASFKKCMNIYLNNKKFTITLKDFKKLFYPELLRKMEWLVLNGNFGESIMNKQYKEINS